MDVSYTPFDGAKLLNLCPSGSVYRKKVSTLVRKVTLDMQQDARDMAPVQTGNLRDSITPQFGELFGRISTNVEYAAAQEYSEGFDHSQQKNPNGQFGFMRKSLDKAKENLDQGIAFLLEKMSEV